MLYTHDITTSTLVHFSAARRKQKEDLEHFKHVIKICPNRGHIFQNELRNKWMAILKTLAGLLLKVWMFSS